MIISQCEDGITSWHITLKMIPGIDYVILPQTI